MCNYNIIYIYIYIPTYTNHHTYYTILVHTCMHACMHACMHTYIHTCTHRQEVNKRAFARARRWRSPSASPARRAASASSGRRAPPQRPEGGGIRGLGSDGGLSRFRKKNIRKHNLLSFCVIGIFLCISGKPFGIPNMFNPPHPPPSQSL